MKFCDIATFVSNASGEFNWETFVSRVKTHGLDKPMYYSLYHTELVYPETIPMDILDRIRPTDLDYIKVYGQTDLDKPKEWKKSFIDRLFSLDRNMETDSLKWNDSWME